MRIQPGPGEPTTDAWQRVPVAVFAERLVAPYAGRDRVVIAVDGRGGGGKSTLAHRLAATIPDAAVLSTDDVAWGYSMFGWDEVLAAGILRPFQAGESVQFRPPGWDSVGRTGALHVDADTRVLIVEGVGASRRSLTDHIDVPLWVRSDFAEAERRGIARDIASGVNGNEAETIAFWHHWMAEELPFFEADRPWERAVAIVAGTAPDAGVHGALDGDQVAIAAPSV